MATLPKAQQDLVALKATVETITVLINQLKAPSSTEGSPSTDEKINALDLAHDAASLIKAHSTKLSLLIINEPFTATAISTVLRELISGPLPGLASALELCTALQYTKVLRSELQYRVTRVLLELGTLVNIIPLTGNILSENQKLGKGKGEGKGSLAHTAVVWKACDDVMELRRLGIAGLLLRKTEEYRSLLKDALEELTEWGEEEGDDDESDAESCELDGQDAVDALFASERHISLNDAEKIRPRLESCKKRLRLVILMYQAIGKRRIKTLPQLLIHEGPLKEKEQITPGNYLDTVDAALDHLRIIPDVTDELASAFYDLDGSEIDRRMKECLSNAVEATERLKKNWNGEEDEFTAWALKFQIAIEQE